MDRSGIVRIPVLRPDAERPAPVFGALELRTVVTRANGRRAVSRGRTLPAARPPILPPETRSRCRRFDEVTSSSGRAVSLWMAPAACGQSHAAFDRRSIPPEPPPHREGWPASALTRVPPPAATLNRSSRSESCPRSPFPASVLVVWPWRWPFDEITFSFEPVMVAGSGGACRRTC